MFINPAPLPSKCCGLPTFSFIECVSGNRDYMFVFLTDVLLKIINIETTSFH
jgi:hypothetical protein